MASKVLSVYVNTYRFFYENLGVLFLFLSSNILCFYLQLWKPENRFLDFLISFINGLLFILIITYMIVIVYKVQGLYDLSLSVASAVKKYYGKTLLIVLLGGVFSVISILPVLCIFLSFVSWTLDQSHILIFQVVVVLVCGPIVLGPLVLAPRWLTLYGGSVLDAIKRSFQELRKEFLFYYLVSMIWFMIGGLPFLFFLHLSTEYNWIKSLLSSLWTSWSSVLFTIAFIQSRNKDFSLVHMKKI